ncbi:MAG: helix-turn-helix transcriptional regulator [Cyclobacteriaceae bacterium]|nr:helix-turn-helix transcriptional regulator [Cyclobacteriaceae bacterium HetDA_MAG_MS6]
MEDSSTYVKQDLGPGISTKIRFWRTNQIRLAHSLLEFDRPTSFHGKNESDVVRLHFGLKGDYRFHCDQLRADFDLVGGHHNVMYSNGLDIHVHNKTLQIETFGIDLPKSIFLQITDPEDPVMVDLTERIAQGEGALLFPRWGTLTIPIQKAIDEIIYAPYKDKLAEIFLWAKSLELLVLCIDHHQKASKERSSFIKIPSDKEKLIAARDFVSERITSPPTLTEVAKTVGMNEFKLKRGFKEMFGTTIFNYLTTRRLHLAKQYLSDTEKTVAEVADLLGYSSPQHFNGAFKKTFGYSPGYVRRPA